MNTALIWMLIFNFILVCFPGYNGNNQNNKPTLGTNDLPAVLSKNHSDLISSRLRDEAKQQFSLLNLPDCKSEWERYSVFLRNKIREKAVVHVNHGLPLNIREFDSIPLNGYSIKNIAFQTLPGVYATANLFVPQGKGPFPAVINLHAHSGRFDDNDQAGLAGLFFGALNDSAEGIILRNAPVSYLFDERESVDFYSMAIHPPGFLQWGDISLATALSGKDVTFINPVTMSGQEISDDKLNEFKTEFEKLRKICKQPGNTFFNEIRNAD